ncbi:MAG: calcium-binding protein [Devosia sp.]
MSTQLDVNLTADLQARLDEPGINAYAVYFAGKAGTDPQFTALVDNGAVASGGAVTIDLPPSLVGGKIYFLIQSEDPSQPTNSLLDIITKESDINWENAKAWDVRYDSFEVTLQNSPFDAGNLTSVNGFGIPMELAVGYDDGSTGTRGYGITGTELFENIAKIGDDTTVFEFSAGPLQGQPRAAISPSEAVGIKDPAFAADDWSTYIDSLKTSDLGIEISGIFNGAPDANNIWHNAGFFSYTLEWDASANDNKGGFWLSPTDSSDIRGYILLDADQLANSIYSTLGDVGIYADKDGEPYRILGEEDFQTGSFSMNSGANNQWGNVLTQVLTGFTAGFYGTEGISPNPLSTDPVDLNKNTSWDPIYAFGQKLASGPAPFQDAYSEIFYASSNSYGSGYSDNLMRQYAEGGPLISVSNNNGTNVDKIAITLFDDGETPAGYIKPVIYNYIAPDPSGYATPAGSTNVANNFKLDLQGADIVLTEDATVALDILSSIDGAGAPVWTSVEFATPEGGSRWVEWDLSWDGTSYTATPKASNSQGVGNLLIANLPVADEGVHWYRLRIGEDGEEKTFNLYADVSNSGFINPRVGGNPGAIAVDGLAQIALPDVEDPTINTFTVNFIYQSTNTIDPKAIRHKTRAEDAGAPLPDAPVAGTLTGDDFNALAGQTSQSENTITTNAASIAFGWTGLNNLTPDPTSPPPAESWIAGYTNKVGGENFAQIDVSASGMSGLPSLTAAADLDGQWQTSAHAFGNGTYTFTMSEYRFSDTQLSEPIGKQSNALTLTVDIAALGLAKAGENAVQLRKDGADTPPANWIDVDLLSAPDTAGATLLFYRTTHDGALVDRGGATGPNVTLESATVASLGAYVDDGGELLGLAGTTLLLQADHRLEFAVLDPDGSVDLDPDVGFRRSGDDALTITVGDFQLSAEAENDLSSAAMLGAGQRLSGEALVWLEHGALVEIDLLGDTKANNSVGLVRVEKDAEGALSVGGVPFGETDASQSAVRDALEPGFASDVGEGSFAATKRLAVTGETGHYAPVLFTQDGRVVVPGASEEPLVRTLGDAVFAFEDGFGRTADDFNDLIVSFAVVSEPETPLLEGEADLPIAVRGRLILGPDGFVSNTDGAGIGAPGFGITVRDLPDGTPAKLVVRGDAHFEGASSGVRLVGEKALVFVRDDGVLAFKDPSEGSDAHLLEIRGGAEGGRIINDGVIDGPVALFGGDDVLSGSGHWGGDVRTGGGDDTFRHKGEQGVSHVRLGSGDDHFRSFSSQDTEVAGNAGSDTLVGGDGADALRGGQDNDRLSGANGDDTLVGGAGADVVKGGEDNDRLMGGDGHDILFGGEGDDTLDGGRGSDRLNGGAGDDLLDGGAGQDRLMGGQGRDTFVLQSDGIDIVVDFQTDDDMIALGPLGLQPSDLSIAEVAGGVRVSAGDQGLLLLGVSADDISLDIFV